MGGSLEVEDLGVFYYLSAYENWPKVMDFGGSGLIYMRESTILKKKNASHNMGYLYEACDHKMYGQCG
jgi:hypothetical protein